MAIKTPYNYKPQELKNWIINGDMSIAQRGTSFAAAGNGLYFLDRWLYNKTGAAVHTVSQDTDVPTFAESGYSFSHSMRFNLTTPDTSLAAADLTQFQQRIEGYNFRDIAQKTLTLSFWVKATLAGTYCVNVRNNDNTLSQVKEYTINASNTWEKKTVTYLPTPQAGTWNYTNDIGLRVAWTIAAGTDFQTTANTWNAGNFLSTANQVNGTNTGATDFRITGVMLNVGREAAPFRLFAGGNWQDEFQVCKRYYEKSYRYDHAPGTATSSGLWSSDMRSNTTTGMESHTNWSVEKRTTPTVQTYDTAGNSGVVTDYVSGSFVPSLARTLTAQSSKGFRFFLGGTASRGGVAWHWTAEAEL